LVYEVGGPLEREVAEWIADKARESDDGKLMARAREIFPGIESAEAGDEQAPQKRRKAS
jgi:hypothetical protein